MKDKWLRSRLNLKSDGEYDLRPLRSFPGDIRSDYFYLCRCVDILEKKFDVLLSHLKLKAVKGMLHDDLPPISIIDIKEDEKEEK